MNALERNQEVSVFIVDELSYKLPIAQVEKLRNLITEEWFSAALLGIQWATEQSIPLSRGAIKRMRDAEWGYANDTQKARILFERAIELSSARERELVPA